jgi:hypothetical protein
VIASDPTGHKDQVDDGGSCDSLCLKKQKNVCRPNDWDCLDRRGSYNRSRRAGSTSPIPNDDAEATVEDMLLSNPKFDPFGCKYSAGSDCIYSGSEAEKIDKAFLKLYQDYGIDLDYYALHELANPLPIDQVSTELQGSLTRRGNYAITLFLKQIENEGGNKLWGVRVDPQHYGQDLLNYEPNYVFHLMLTHPTILAHTIEIVNNMPPGQWEQLNNTSPGW